MREWVFELAVSAIATSAPDSLVNRLIRSIAHVADCPTAVLVVPRDGRQEIISSYGLPSIYRRRFVDEAPADPTLREQVTILDNLKADERFLNSASVHGPLGIRFIAIAPVTIPFADYGVHVIVGDFRDDVRRRSDLKDILGTLAGIVADAIKQQGELAVLEHQLDSIRQTAKRFSDLALQSSETIVLVDENARIVGASQGFSERFRSVRQPASGALGTVFARDDLMIEDQLDRMRSEREPISSLRVRPPDTGKEELLDILSLAPGGPGAAAFACHLRPFLLSNRDDGPTRELIVDRTADPSAGEQDRGREDAGVTAGFLLNTLVRQPRLAARKQVSYHTLRRWRGPIKDYQIEALKALKKVPPQAFVDSVAGELLDAADQLFGKGTFDAVVAVPCGHSGPDCLARKLASSVATLAGLPHVEAFEPLAVTGSSHPRTNARRAAMKIRSTVTGRVLLIDDVASSGAHLAEATELLRRSGATVFPLAWIGR